jgi:hypothetical protein
MKYTYHFNVLAANGRITQESEKIDATTWLESLRTDTERYGNLYEFITAGLEAARRDNPLLAASLAQQLDEACREADPTLLFQFTLYCWHAFKAGQIPAGAWAAVLANAWQAEGRAMLDHVSLPLALVLDMFSAADREALFRVGASRKDWDAYYAALPDEIDIYRGITTGMKHLEDGLSWTTNANHAREFSGRNVRTASEIPGVIHARVPKQALLATLDIRDEVVIDPRIPKLNPSTQYLSGTGLIKFRKNWKKWQEAQEERIAKAGSSN